MGAVSFSLDKKLVQALKSALPITRLVETGTFRGDTVQEFLKDFESIISVEMSVELWRSACERFSQEHHVKVMCEDSPRALRSIEHNQGDTGTLYWLDAHWCVADSTAGELSQCPLLDEIEAIGELSGNSVILIDDARLFLAPPLKPHDISQWPTLDEIVRKLFLTSPDHELAVINDVIAFFPKAAKKQITAYAQEFGTDWLEVYNFFSSSRHLVQMINEKEIVIHEKEQSLQQLSALLSSKEAVIRELSAKANRWDAAIAFVPLLSPVLRAARRLALMLRPRLGWLNQYSGRPLGSLTKRSSYVGKRPAHSPKISIVTPSYNQAEFIERTLLSVLEQNYPNLEYFVQDGNSKDSTVEVLKKYDRKLSGWVSEPDTGQSQAINRGFAKTSGDIMGWLNSDDILLPDTLSIVADYFSRHPEIDVVYGNRLMIDEDDMEIGRWIMPAHNDEVLSWADFIPQETMFWRRAIWEKAGGHIDESFRFAMDWDLIVRFRKVGARFKRIPCFLGGFRIHKEQKTSAVISEVGYQEMGRIRQRELGYSPEREAISKAVRPYLVRHILMDIAWRLKVRLSSFFNRLVPRRP